MKIIRLLHLLSYLCVTSQVLFYLIVFSDALKLTTISNFIEQRRSVDQIIAGRFTLIYLVCLIMSVIVVLLSIKINQLSFSITSIISLLCLIADIIIAYTGNIPINKQIGSLTGELGIAQLELLRTDWLRFINYRAFFSTAGMMSLLIGLIAEIK